MKLNVAEAAAKFKVSKEAIHNRIRRGTLKSVVENGIKYVLVDEPQTPAETKNYDTKYYSYIEEENKRLKEKVEKLEGETKTLRDQREQMLIEERDKIENIYKERDLQLQNVLNVVASKFLREVDSQKMINEAISAEVIEEEHSSEVPLKSYLKLKGVKKERRKKVLKKIAKSPKKDARFIKRDGELFLNPDEFDYDDLL